MKEKLIDFLTAVLAKEKGFNKVEVNSYFHLNEGYKLGYALCYSEVLNQTKTCLLAPTQSLLQKWIRELHGIHILIIPTITGNWTYKTVTVISERDEDVIKGIKSVSDVPPYKEVCGYDFSTYELTLEDALYEALKLIKIEDE